LIEILAGVPRGEWDDADALAQAMIYFGPVMSPLLLNDKTVLISGSVIMDEDGGSPWNMN
jgi:hypothetical protein